MDVLKSQKVSSDFLRQMPRKWEAGDVYSPHDLSPVEMTKWKKRTKRNSDVVDALGISPLDMYKVRNAQESKMEREATDTCNPELLPHRALHHPLLHDLPLKRDPSPTRQPAQGCQDDSTSPRNGYLPQRARPPRDATRRILHATLSVGTSFIGLFSSFYFIFLCTSD